MNEEVKKQFAPFELSIKLREFGFDKPCIACWLHKKYSFNHKENVLYIDQRFANGQDQIYNNEPIECLAPTWQEAFSFMYEKLKLNENYTYNLIFDGEFNLDRRIEIEYEPDYVETIAEGNEKTLIKLIKMYERRIKFNENV